MMKPGVLLLLVLGGLLLFSAVTLPADVQKTLAEANASLAAGDLTQALAQFRQVAQSSSGERVVALEIAQVQFALAQQANDPNPAYVAAREAWLTAAKYEGFTPTIRRGLAESLLALGDTLGAAEQWEHLFAADPSDPSLWYQLAPAHRSQGEWEAAERAYAALSSIEPGNPEYQYWLGALLLPTEPLTAREHLLQASQDPYYAQRAESLLAAAAPVSELASGHPAGRLGVAYLAVGEPQMAVGQLQAAVTQNPDYAEAWAYLGFAQDQLGQDGLPSLERALTLAPDNPLIHSLLGRHWLQREDTTKARDSFIRARELDPDNPAHAADVAATYQLENDNYSAAAWYQEAVKQAPDDPAFWMLLSRFNLEILQDPAGGLVAAQRAVSLAPEDAAALDALGWAQFQNDQPRLAENNLLAAQRRDPTNPAVYFHLGRLYDERGEFEAAQQAYQQAVLLDSTCKACAAPIVGAYGQMAQRILDNR